MKGCRPLTDEETSLISNSLSLRDKALFITGCKSGFRISELLSLSVKDILSNGKIVNHINMSRCNMKGKQEGRAVVLHPAAKEALSEYISSSGLQSHDKLFKSLKGGSISRIQAWRVFNQAYSILGLSGKLGTHCMRKTFADRMYTKLDKDLIKVQQALGHKSINSTVSYLSFKQEDIDEAILS